MKERLWLFADALAHPEGMGDMRRSRLYVACLVLALVLAGCDIDKEEVFLTIFIAGGILVIALVVCFALDAITLPLCRKARQKQTMCPQCGKSDALENTGTAKDFKFEWKCKYCGHSVWRASAGRGHAGDPGTFLPPDI